MRSVALPMFLSLTACSALVPSTVVQLMSLSPLTADPEALAIQIVLPDSVGIVPNSAVLVLSNTFEGETTEGRFVLDQSGDVYRIAPNDVEPLRQLQATIRTQEEAQPDDNSGSLSVNAAPCLNTANASVEETVSVSIQAAKDGPFLPLFRDQPLSALFGQQDLVTWPTCPTAE
ncbi:MAG: hypothetical protein AAFP98_02965 [Pseudomonadota bacterium]